MKTLIKRFLRPIVGPLLYRVYRKRPLRPTRPRPKADPKGDFGLVLDWAFHASNGWCSAVFPYLAEALIAKYRPVIISSQADYDRHKHRLGRILSMEPGWAAPHIKYDTSVRAIKAVFYSDPQYHAATRQAYLEDNDFTYVFSLYKQPFFRHFPTYPKERFVHMTWAIPDEFVSDEPLSVRGDEVAIFGAKGAASYDVRDWCREQPGVTSYANSGVQNKKMTDAEFFAWMRGFDAVVCAGSSDPDYDMVFPKYFEVAAAGTLLFAHRCKDLPDLGFTEENCVIFDKADFNDKLKAYKADPAAYLPIREAGRRLIRERHTLSRRLAEIHEVFYGEKR
jgi:hypothetical protein